MKIENSYLAIVDFKPLRDHVLQELRHKLPRGLCYHGYQHTIEVYESARILSICSGLDVNSQRLVLTAALTHDIGYIETANGHEQAGVEWIKTHLPHFDYSPEEIADISTLVLDTDLALDIHHPYSGLLRDADLDYLGTEDFYRIGNRLFQEFKYQGIVRDTWDWNQLQVNFLKHHTYHTPFSKINREPLKQRYLHELDHWLLEHPSPLYMASEKKL